MLRLISPTDKAELSVLTEFQKEFVRRVRPIKDDPGVPPANPDSEASYPWFKEVLKTTTDRSHPSVVIFKWTYSDLLEPVKFELSTSPDFSTDDTIGIATLGEIYTSADEPDVYCLRAENLLSGTTYYWRVSAGDESEVRSFTTTYGEFRPIRAGSLTNIRDIGGRVNADGRRVKQGLVFRGPSLEELLDTNDSHFDRGGYHVLKDDLKIKTEIDLRGDDDDITDTVLGDGVAFNEFQFFAWGGTLNDGGRATLREVIELFADKDIFPAYFHCAVGADRTGTIGAYLDVILGMSEEEIRLNYNFTSLAHREYRNWDFDQSVIDYTTFLEETYPDASLTERIMINLLKSGITEETLQRIRDNLLE